MALQVQVTVESVTLAAIVWHAKFWDTVLEQFVAGSQQMVFVADTVFEPVGDVGMGGDESTVVLTLANPTPSARYYWGVAYAEDSEGQEIEDIPLPSLEQYVDAAHFADSFETLDNWTVEQGSGGAAPEAPSVVADGVWHAGAEALDCVKIPPTTPGQANRPNRLMREIYVRPSCDTLDITVYAKIDAPAAAGDFNEKVQQIIRLVHADPYKESKLNLIGEATDNLYLQQAPSGVTPQANSRNSQSPGKWAELTLRTTGLHTDSTRQQIFVNGEQVRWTSAGAGDAGYYSSGDTGLDELPLTAPMLVRLGNVVSSGDPPYTIYLDGVAIRQYDVGEAPAVPWSTTIANMTMTPGENQGEMHVRCWTPKACSVTLQLGEATPIAMTATLDGREHNVLLTGLTDATEYAYTLLATVTGDSTDTYKRTGTFNTDPGDADTKVLIWSDVQDTGKTAGIASRVREQVADIDLVLSAGDVSGILDMTWLTGWSEADQINSMQRSLIHHDFDVPVILTPGNHDLGDSSATTTLFTSMSARREENYYFDWGYARYIVIDAAPYGAGFAGANISAAQLTFVENALASSTKYHNIVVGHQALHWDASEVDQGSNPLYLGQIGTNQEELFDILKAYGAVYIHGHHHQYCVWNLGGLWQVSATSPASTQEQGPTVNGDGESFAAKAWGTWHQSLLTTGFGVMLVTPTHIDFQTKDATGAHITTIRILQRPGGLAAPRELRT